MSAVLYFADSILRPIDISSLGSCAEYSEYSTIEIKIGYPTIRSVVLLVGPISVTPYAVIPESGIPSLGRPVLLGNNMYAASTEPLTVYCWLVYSTSLSLSLYTCLILSHFYHRFTYYFLLSRTITPLLLYSSPLYCGLMCSNVF